MIGGGRTVGMILIVVGLAFCLLATLFVGSGYASSRTTLPATILGIGVFGIIPLLLFGGVGAYLFVRGSAEERDLASVRKKELLLGMIQAQGKVTLSTIMIEQHLTREQVTNDIYELVNQGLFSGYIDWQAGTFYSKDAGKVGSNKCPNCGGIRELVGKGVVKCPYCGVELFIPPDAPQTVATPVPPPGYSGTTPVSNQTPGTT
jgi:DNA-directed RNA polymerase subunit RPC12/RpoP